MSHDDDEDSVCAYCLELIRPPSLSYVMDLVVTTMKDGMVRHQLLLESYTEALLEPEEGEAGADEEPLLEALHFHDNCWDTVSGEVKSFVEDAPPVPDVVNVVVCDMCGDTIRIGERSVVLRHGRQVSSKKKDGTGTFKRILGERYDFCLTCAMRIADVVECDMWSELSQFGECYDCTSLKCWRDKGKCDCPCHLEGEEDEH